MHKVADSVRIGTHADGPEGSFYFVSGLLKEIYARKRILVTVQSKVKGQKSFITPQPFCLDCKIRKYFQVSRLLDCLRL